MPMFQHWCRSLASEQHVISHTSCVFCLRAHYMCRTKAIFTGLTSNFDSILRTLCFIVRHCIILWNDVFKPVHNTTANILLARIFHIASIKTCYKCGIHVFFLISFFLQFFSSVSICIPVERNSNRYRAFFMRFLSLFSWNVECLFALCPWILLFIPLLHLNLAVARKIPAQANINWQMNTTFVPFSFSFSVCVFVCVCITKSNLFATIIHSHFQQDIWISDATISNTPSHLVSWMVLDLLAPTEYICRLWHECSCSCSLFICTCTA